MTDKPDYNAALPARVDIDSGVPGLTLTHHVTRLYAAADGDDRVIPGDGAWDITHVASGRAVNISRTGFRALHAAAHMAQLLAPLADWTSPEDQVVAVLDPALVRHAEAHGHEVDAAWPPGNTIPFSNGPSIIDHTGDTRRFLAQAPVIDWVKNDDGTSVCSVCGALPAGDPT